MTHTVLLSPGCYVPAGVHMWTILQLSDGRAVLEGGGRSVNVGKTSPWCQQKKERGSMAMYTFFRPFFMLPSPYPVCRYVCQCSIKLFNYVRVKTRFNVYLQVVPGIRSVCHVRGFIPRKSNVRNMLIMKWDVCACPRSVCIRSICCRTLKVSMRKYAS